MPARDTETVRKCCREILFGWCQRFWNELYGSGRVYIILLTQYDNSSSYCCHFSFTSHCFQ